jgi:hypothetical protein
MLQIRIITVSQKRILLICLKIDLLFVNWYPDFSEPVVVEEAPKEEEEKKDEEAEKEKEGEEGEEGDNKEDTEVKQCVHK